MKRHAKALVIVVIAMLCLGAGTALALQTHLPATPGEVDGSLVPNGSFGPLGGLAVDQGGGDLYVVDTTGSEVDSTGAIQHFESPTAYLDQLNGVATAATSLGLNQDSHVAIDSSGTSSDGTAYVTDNGNNLVVAFDSETGALETAFDSDGELDGSGTPIGSFATPCAVAVDQANGNLFLADQNNNRIWIFDSSGKYLDKIADPNLSGPCGLALNAAGDGLYVRNAYDGRVLRFNRTGGTDFGFGFPLYNPGEQGEPGATDIALDTSDEHVYVDKGDRVSEYEPFGGVVSTFGQGQHGEAAIAESHGVAVDSASGRIYVSDNEGGTNKVRVFGTAVTLPDVTTGAVANVTGETATLKGNLDALGIETECEFEYDTAPFSPGQAPHGQSAPCEPAGPHFGAEAVHADVAGLSPATTYHYRLRASSAEGFSDGADQSFATDGAPIVESLSFTGIGSEAAELHARINPAGDATTYRFEYTSEADFEANEFANAKRAPEPDGSLLAGNTAQPVSAAISGLTPGTRYVLRALAANGAGSGESAAPRRFKTFALPKAHQQGQFPGQGFLPDNRAWELVSPPEKFGNDVMADTTDIRAAADGSAVSFASLGGFAGVQGAGVSTEYLAQRTAAAQTNGWATHAITPPQEPLSFFAASSGLSPTYRGEFSADLSKAVFQAFSPLTDAPNVAHIASNLYLRDDLRSPTAGFYSLLSDAASELAPSPSPISEGNKIFLAGASEDFEHIIFESPRSLTGTGGGLYKSDGPGLPRRIARGAAGRGAATKIGYTLRTISSDGSRVQVSAAGGRLFEFDDRGSADPADDAIFPVSASEASSPGPGTGRFESASTDGNRVFLRSEEALTEDSTGDGLYMWERADQDETQQVTVDATGGTFTLTFHLIEGVEATTAPLPFDASAGEVRAALEALVEEGTTIDNPGRPLIGAGNVAVSGGPGGSGPYEVSFTGALHGVDVAELSADGSGLSGGGATVGVATTDPIHNLSLIANFSGDESLGVIGASEDGRRMYFAGRPELANGEPDASKGDSGIYYWQDADGTPGGTLSAIGGVPVADLNPVTDRSFWPVSPKVSRVTPDGRNLIFEVTEGGSLAPEFDWVGCANLGNPNSNANSGCSEVFLYRADTSTPTKPDVICLSCNPSGAPRIASAYLQRRQNASAAPASTHLSHAISDDGRYVFFSSPERLVAEDINGIEDAYVYDTVSEEPRLLSSGRSTSPSYFADASADGSDAFILTQEQLSDWDKDGSIDLYDARVGGGLPEPPPAPPSCQGDACQPAPKQPNDPTPASAGFHGAGNPKPPIKQCAKGRKKVRARNGGIRCVKAGKNRKRANHNRRAGR